MPAQWDEEADIVIVGGGGAGGAAAYAGRKAGVDVLVLESQSSTTFSSTALSGDSICFVGTEEQAAAGIEDSAEAFMQECLELGEHANKEEVIQTYLDHNLEYYEILKEIGVQFEGVVMLDTTRRAPSTSARQSISNSSPRQPRSLALVTFSKPQENGCT